MLIVFRSCDNRNLHPAKFINFVVLNLREDQLIPQAKCIIATPVKRIGRNTAKITYPWESDIQEAVQKCPHSIAAQRHLATHDTARAPFGGGHILAGLSLYWLLTGHRAQIRERSLQRLRV